MEVSNSTSSSDAQRAPQGPETNCQPRTTFSSLPAELRQKIWLLTLQPRVLYLNIHMCVAYPAWDEDGEILGGFNRLVSVSFSSKTAKISQLPRSAFEEYSKYVDHKSFNLDSTSNQATTYLRNNSMVAAKPWSVKNSRGPVALEVCSESRGVALKRYEFAFGGVFLSPESEDKEEWDRTRLGGKRIWVDFKQDIIFIDTIYRPRIHARCPPQNPLGILRRYAPEDSNRIRRLALGSTWDFSPTGGGELMGVLRGRQISARGVPVWRRKAEWLLDFDDVVELLVDDRFKDHEGTEMNLSLNGKSEENFIADDITERMRDGRRRCTEWTADVPLVKIIRGAAWASYIE